MEVALADSGVIRGDVGATCDPITFDASIMGLSPHTNTTEGPSFRENLITTGLISKRIQSMWMYSSREAKATFEGISLFGALDISKFTGPMIVLDNMKGEFGYHVEKPTMSVNGVTFKTDVDVTCELDSGSASITLPIAYDDTPNPADSSPPPASSTTTASSSTPPPAPKSHGIRPSISPSNLPRMIRRMLRLLFLIGTLIVGRRCLVGISRNVRCRLIRG